MNTYIHHPYLFNTKGVLFTKIHKSTVGSSHTSGLRRNTTDRRMNVDTKDVNVPKKTGNVRIT